MMELRTFISKALLDIVGAVQDTQKATPKGTIVPGGIAGTFQAFDHGVSHLQVVHFEVSVTVDESKGSEGKLGVLSSFVSAGVSGKQASEQKHASVLKFKIPIQLPTSGLLVAPPISHDD